LLWVAVHRAPGCRDRNSPRRKRFYFQRISLGKPVIEHRKIETAAQRAAALPAVYRYGGSQPWSVGVLAGAAAAAVLVLFGGISEAFAPRDVPVGQSSRRADAPIAARAAPAAAEAPAVTGQWQIQLGAFRNAAGARARLRAMEREVPALAKLSARPQTQGAVTRARIGGIATRAEASALCAGIARTGRGCFVVAPGT
jgi:hypothetical protein